MFLFLSGCLLLKILNSQTQNNLTHFTFTIEKNQTIYAQSSKNLIFETNDAFISKNTKINYDLMQLAFKIESFEKEKMITLLMMNSFYFSDQFAYCICQLFLSAQNYYISCIDGIHIDLYKSTTYEHKNAQKYQIWISKSQGVECKCMYTDIKNQIKVLCLASDEIKVYSINLRSQVSIELTQKIIHNLQVCLIKYLYYAQCELIIFYNCLNWQIIQVKDQLLELFLNSEILIMSELALEILHLADISVCQNYLYLIEYNNYYIIYQKNLLFQKFFQHSFQTKIVKIILSNICQATYIIENNESNQDNSVIIILKGDEISFPQWLNFTQTFNTQSYFILKRNSSLYLVLSDLLSQEYQILPSDLFQLNFQVEENQKMLNIPELYYQINYKNKDVVFYKFLKLKNFIQPTKKYIYEIEPTIFSLGRIVRYEIQYKDYNYYQNNIDNNPFAAQIINNCNQIQFQISKNQQFPPFHQVQIKEIQNNYINSIVDEVDFITLCPYLDLDQNSQIIWVSIFYDIVLAVITKNNFLIYNCKNNFKFYEFNIQDKEVFSYQGYFFLSHLNANKYLFFQFENNTIDATINYFDENVLEIKQIAEVLIIKFPNAIKIYNFLGFQLQQIDDKFLQFGLPEYYYDHNSYQIFQYRKQLFIKLKTKKIFLVVQIQNIQILQIISFKLNFKIKAVHNEQNKIFIYYFDGEELILESELQLNEYQIQRPKIMQESVSLLIIAAVSRENKKMFLFINSESGSIIVKTKYTKSFTCFSYMFEFFYFDQFHNMKMLSFNYYTIILKPDFHQLNHLDKIDQHFNINYFENNSLQSINAKIQLEIFNKCYALSLLKKEPLSLILNTNNVSLLKISDIFLGPIDNINCKGQGFNIQGPFFGKKLNTCDINVSGLCQLFIPIQFLSQIFFKLLCIRSQEIPYQDFPFCSLIEITQDCRVYQHSYFSEQKILVLLLINKYQQPKIYIFIYSQTANIFIETQDISFPDPQEQHFSIEFIFAKHYQNQYFMALSYDQRSIYVFCLEIQSLILDFISNKFSDLIEMNNSNSQFLALDHQILNQSFALKLFNYSNSQFTINCQVEINFNQLLQKLRNCLLSNYQFSDYEVLNLQIVQSNQINKQVQAIFLLKYKEFQFEIQIQFDIESKDLDIQINKIIRNPLQFEQLENVFYDLNILLIKDHKASQESQTYYLYDLRENKSMYDYMHKIEKGNFTLRKFNSTFYIVQENQNMLYLDEIGYQVTVFEKENQGQRFIMAQNSLSNVSVEILLTFSQKQIQSEFWFISIFQGSVLILLIIAVIFLIRRSRFKISQKIMIPKRNIDQIKYV